VTPALTAQNSFYPFEDTKGSVLDPASKGWHQEYEGNGDYGEIWFFVAQTKEGGVLFASLAITNLGLRTYDGSCTVNFYAPDGEKYQMHSEYRRRDISGTEGKMDVTVGPNRVWAEGDSYHLTLNEKNLKLSMTFEGKLPAFQFGNGRVFFYEDRSAEWSVGFHAPRATVRGDLSVDGRNFNLEGYGYHDHSWSTIKLPTFVDKWYTLRLYDQRVSIILHQIYLTDQFGGGMLRLGMVGENGRLQATSDFRYEPLKWREDGKSRFEMPTEFEVFINAGGYTITGKVKEWEFLDSIDVLEVVSWPVRSAIKAFYTSPFFLRYLANCEIDMINKNGERHHISTLGLVETNVYHSTPEERILPNPIDPLSFIE
jgi:hypothetical protein